MLPGMPDTVVLSIINLNIDSIQVEIMSTKTNRGQDTHTIAEGCTNRNMAGVIKQDANGQNGQNQTNHFITFIHQKTQRQIKGRAMP